MCSSALPCVCVIYNIISARDWLRVTIYLNCARISLASVDNWENFPRGTEIYGDFIYFKFQNQTPILTAFRKSIIKLGFHFTKTNIKDSEAWAKMKFSQHIRPLSLVTICFYMRDDPLAFKGSLSNLVYWYRWIFSL